MGTNKFASLIAKSAKADEIAQHLDSLRADQRIQEVLTMPLGHLGKLWKLIQSKPLISADKLAPEVEKTVIYELRNSVAILPNSQKRFYRTTTGEVFGYNHSSAFERFFAGPGYFVVEPENNQLVFDYTKLPSAKPEGWPPLRPNKGLIPGLVFGGLRDEMRIVSTNTVLGAAFKGKKPINVYFILTRAE